MHTNTIYYIKYDLIILNYINSIIYIYYMKYQPVTNVPYIQASKCTQGQDKTSTKTSKFT